MGDDDLAVLRHPDVELEHVGAGLDRALERVQRVRGELVLAALVGDVEDALLEPGVVGRRGGGGEHQREGQCGQESEAHGAQYAVSGARRTTTASALAQHAASPGGAVEPAPVAREVQRDENRAAADVGEHAVLRAHELQRPGRQRLLGAAQREQAAVEREQRSGVALLRGDAAACRPSGSHGSPAGKPPSSVHAHRRPHRVAPEARHAPLPRVLHPVGRDRDVAHPELVAVVEGRRPAQGEQQHGRHARLRRRRSRVAIRGRSWLPST